jgi:hypothetical protein
MTDRHSADSSATFNRAQLIKKLAVGAFAIPVIATFKLDSLARAGTRKRGGHSYPNQTQPNQTYPNQTQPNQSYPNQTQPNQTYPNQTYPNQTRCDPKHDFPNQTLPDQLSAVTDTFTRRRR